VQNISDLILDMNCDRFLTEFTSEARNVRQTVLTDTGPLHRSYHRLSLFSLHLLFALTWLSYRTSHINSLCYAGQLGWYLLGPSLIWLTD